MKKKPEKTLKKKIRASEFIKRKIKKQGFVPPTTKISLFSALYKNIPANRIVLIAFVIVAMLSIFIYGTKIRTQLSIIPILEIALAIFVIGMTVFYPEKYTKQIGLTICAGAGLFVLLELLKGVFSIEIFLSALMLICGAIVYILK